MPDSAASGPMARLRPSDSCTPSPMGADWLVMCATTRLAMPSIGKMASTSPVAMTLRGMPSNLAFSGSWAIRKPPASLMAPAPRVPSDPVPDNTTPTAWSPWWVASDWKNTSIGRVSVRGLLGVSRSSEPSVCMMEPGGIRNTLLPWMGMFSSTISTGMDVCRASKLAIMLLWSGDRC